MRIDRRLDRLEAMQGDALTEFVIDWGDIPGGDDLPPPCRFKLPQDRRGLDDTVIDLAEEG